MEVEPVDVDDGNDDTCVGALHILLQSVGVVVQRNGGLGYCQPNIYSGISRHGGRQVWCCGVVYGGDDYVCECGDG